MKALSISLFLVTALMGTVSAQVTIDMSNCPFQIGIETHQTVHEGQTNFPKFSTTGINNTWDFSFLTPEPGYLNVLATLNTSTLSCPEDAPTANALVVEYDPEFPQDAYYSICVLNEDSLSIIGDYDNTLACHILPDGIRYFSFPFEYGDSNTDSYEYSEGFVYSITNEYSAWGALTLPNGISYDEVALLSFIDEFYVQYTFLAYVEGQFQVVMQMDSDGYYLYNENTFVLSAEETTAASFQIIHQGDNQYMSNDWMPREWEVYNTLGQQVMTANNTSRIVLDGLETGVYIIRASRGDQIQTLKVFCTQP
jgi:hypothetical protein